MEIQRNGSQASGKAPADWFMGSVRLAPLFQAPKPAEFRAPALRLSLTPGRLGIRIRSGKP